MSAKVSFRITTYFKRPRSEAGPTQLGSGRLVLGQALDWILAELPEDSYRCTASTAFGTDTVNVFIDWNRVPAEIRNGMA